MDAAFDRAQPLFGAPRHACTGGSSDGRGESDAARAATPMARSSTANLPAAATDFGLAELYGSVAALARSMRGEFDPRRFLEACSSQLGRLIPHDRLMLVYLEEEGRTFSVFGEHAASGPLRHGAHYTITRDPGSRYTSDQIGHASMFAAQPEVVRDCRRVPISLRPNAIVSARSRPASAPA